MLGFESKTSSSDKCYTTIGKYPAYIDPKQPPTKKSPFAAILGNHFVHTTELILPEEVYRVTWDSIQSNLGKLRYAKVILPLSALLESKFLDTYIKVGNVLMLSEGIAGEDNKFSLKDGVLRLDLDKESYERAGLVGKAVRNGGRKHVKVRYAVEINLRQPSMVHGKRGFERIVWAFKNVLVNSVTWLFCDLASEPSYGNEDSPLKQHYPQIVTSTPDITTLNNILVPPLDATTSTQQNLPSTTKPQPTHLEQQDSCSELSEWLALVSLNSPRTHANDDIDPYLSRYEIPGVEGGKEAKATNLVRVTWRGLIPDGWIVQLLIVLLRRCLSSSSSSLSNPCPWFALSSHCFRTEAVEGKNGYTILSLSPKEEGKENEDTTPATQTPSSTATHSSSARKEFISWEYVS